MNLPNTVKSNLTLLKGIYPFKDIKLRRADVEWLLSTHDNGRGPVNWNDEGQREREGLDLRGAILIDEDLRDLPLAKLCCSLTDDERMELFDINMPIGGTAQRQVTRYRP